MVNSVILQARLVADPELKYTQSNVANLECTVAWSEKYKETETKLFLRCKAWRHNAEFITRYFRKGQEILIEGHMVTEQWEVDGEKKSRTICMIDRTNFCGSKRDNGAAETGTGSEVKPGDDGFMNIPDGIGDELPFN